MHPTEPQPGNFASPQKHINKIISMWHKIPLAVRVWIPVFGIIAILAVSAFAMHFSHKQQSITSTQHTQANSTVKQGVAQKPTTSQSPSSSKAPSTNTTTKPTTSSPTKSNTSAPNSTPPVQPSSSSSGPSSTPPSNGGSTSTPASGYPDASSTGPSGCSSYTTQSGTVTVTTNGAVINCMKLTGTLDVEASNVTIENSILTGVSWWGVQLGVSNYGATNLVINHDTLQTVAGNGPDSGGYDYGISPGQYSTGSMTVEYSNISGYKDGIDITTGSIHDNYIHNLSQFTGSHSQDIYVYSGGSGITIKHNTLINDTPISQASASVYIAPDSPNQHNVTVTQNKLAGGALCLYGGDSNATNIVVTNNGFSTLMYSDCGYYGTDGYWHAGNAGNIWSGNVWADGPNAGQTVNP